MQTNNSPGPKQDPPMNFTWAINNSCKHDYQAELKKMLKGSDETVSTSHAPEHSEFTYLASPWKRKIQFSFGELSHMVNCVLCHTTSEYDPAEHDLKGIDCSALCHI